MSTRRRSRQHLLVLWVLGGFTTAMVLIGWIQEAWLVVAPAAILLLDVAAFSAPARSWARKAVPRQLHLTPELEPLATVSLTLIGTAAVITTLTERHGHRSVIELVLSAVALGLLGVFSASVLKREAEQISEVRRLRQLWSEQLASRLSAASESRDRLTMLYMRVAGDPSSSTEFDDFAKQADTLPEAFVARLGDTAWGAFLMDPPADSEEQAQRVARRLNRQFQHRDARISVGWAAYPRDGTSPAELLSAARERLDV